MPRAGCASAPCPSPRAATAGPSVPPSAQASEFVARDVARHLAPDRRALERGVAEVEADQDPGLVDVAHDLLHAAIPVRRAGGAAVERERNALRAEERLQHVA